jgi:ribosomal RNA-processing protein 9
MFPIACIDLNIRVILHQESMFSIDCWTKDRPISASADRTIRVWKIAEDSHLVFRGHKSSADVVKILTNETFISGGADGNLFLWKETQKKPIAIVKAAHGFEGDDRLQLHNARWISSVSCVKMSDLAASGSNDGYLRLWNVNADNYEMSPVGALPCDGFINDIAMSHRLVVAGTGAEHRMGRWWHMRGPLNKVVVFRLPEVESSGSVGSDAGFEEGEDDGEHSSDDGADVSVSEESDN